MYLLIAIRADSIDRASIHEPEVAIRPYSPKATYELPLAFPS